MLHITLFLLNLSDIKFQVSTINQHACSTHKSTSLTYCCAEHCSKHRHCSDELHAWPVFTNVNCINISQVHWASYMSVNVVHEVCATSKHSVECDLHKQWVAHDRVLCTVYTSTHSFCMQISTSLVIEEKNKRII